MGRRVAAMLIVCALACQLGCGRSLTRRTDARSTPAATSVDAAQPTEAPAIETPSGVTNGSLELQLFDDAGGVPVEIPVAFTGPSAKTIVGDAKGKIRFTGPPGRYDARVVQGCHDRVFVEGGGTAQFRLIGGRMTTGRLRAIWQHRFGPAPPVSASLTGDWPAGERVEVTYGVADRCTDKRAPSAAFPTFTFETSRNLKLVETPRLASDAEGLTKVVVSCTAPGDLTLVVVDRSNPADELDLGELLIGFGGEQRCGS